MKLQMNVSDDYICSYLYFLEHLTFSCQSGFKTFSFRCIKFINQSRINKVASAGTFLMEGEKFLLYISIKKPGNNSSHKVSRGEKFLHNSVKFSISLKTVEREKNNLNRSNRSNQLDLIMMIIKFE